MEKHEHMSNVCPEYHYQDAKPTWANAYLWPEVRRIAGDVMRGKPNQTAFDLGCGSGATANFLSGLGMTVTAIDISESGIAQARKAYPHCKFAVGSAYDDLASIHGRFTIVVSREVVEHCFAPRQFAKTLFDLIEPGGTAVISTPYHGYMKNIALAVSGKLDFHFTALWDGGHVKFFSIKTLTTLLEEAGFSQIEFLRVGRIPPLAKSMIAIAQKPRTP